LNYILGILQYFFFYDAAMLPLGSTEDIFSADF